MAPALQTEIPVLTEFGFYPAADTLVSAAAAALYPQQLVAGRMSWGLREALLLCWALAP